MLQSYVYLYCLIKKEVKHLCNPAIMMWPVSNQECSIKIEVGASLHLEGPLIIRSTRT
jgi:hypothetical protein